MFNPKERGAMFERMKQMQPSPAPAKTLQETMRPIPNMPQLQPMAPQTLAPQSVLPRFARLRRAFGR